MEFTAHIDENDSIQTVKEHCVSVSEISSKMLEKVNLEKTAKVAGLLHDAGKCTKDFDKYINDSHMHKNVKKGSVIHTFAGVEYFLRKYHKNKILDFPEITSEIVACAVGSHHGLLDLFDENQKSAFVHRLNKQPEYDENAINNFLKTVETEDKIDIIYKQAIDEIKKCFDIIQGICNDSDDDIYDEEMMFYAGLICRLITSSLIDADRLDTMHFMTKKNIPNFDSKKVFGKCSDNFEEYISHFESKSEISEARKKLSDLCKLKSVESNGIYRLNIPTGGGKTLSGLRFAVNHAIKNNMDRIIYVSPLLSILEQNAKEIRKALNYDDVILEHHSNVVNDSYNADDIDKFDLLTENWNAPVIITTLVQFLNTLFKSKTSSVRRFHSLCNSVIIIDEVQTVPVKMLSLFNLAMNFLVKVCHSTVILCSATQPDLKSEKQEHKLISDEKNIISDDEIAVYKNVFKRNNIIDKGVCRFENIPELVSEMICNYNSVLVVCNTKSESSRLYSIMSEKFPDSAIKKYHLSASMCIQHRRDVVEELKQSLSGKEKVICISTQVIEAGVDISFDSAIRVMAGMDSIVQTAGRVNRNGENNSDSPVYIVDCADENLKKLEDISKAKTSTTCLLNVFKANSEKYENDLSSDESIKYYYNNLYSSYNIGYMDYTVKNKGSVFEMLSINDKFVGENKEAENYFMRQAFETAGKSFEALESCQNTVIVPYKESEDIIAKLFTEKALYDISYMNELLDSLKSYTVSMFDYQIKKIMESDGITCLGGRILILDKEFYNSKIGFVTEKQEGESECDTQIL